MKPEDFGAYYESIFEKEVRKRGGIYYTPPLYAQKAPELVRSAIQEVPDGNDYVVKKLFEYELLK